MNPPDLSVVICTYNRAEPLQAALKSVLTQETGEAFSFEVVVVDDGSTDATRPTVEALADGAPVPLRYVFQGGRGGIAPARNRGLDEARAQYIVYFDDDQIASPEWLAALMAVVRDKDADCIGGPRRLDIPDAALRRLGPVCRGILGENLYQLPPALLEGKELPTTGNLLLSRRMLDAIGKFDPNAKSSGEDADLLNRARRAGFGIWTAPEAMVAHMIPDYRLTPPYFRWVSLRWGNQFARMDHNHGGLGRVLPLALARIGQAALVHAPYWLLARLGGDAPAALDARILLWRALGYARTALHYLAPGLFPQRQFLDSLSFRNERDLFGGQ